MFFKSYVNRWDLGQLCKSGCPEFLSRVLLRVMTSYLARSKVILSFRNPRARSSRRNTYISVHPPISRTSDPILELLLEGKSYSNLHRDFHWISIDFSQKSRIFLLRRSSEEFLGSKKCRILCGIHFWQLETLSARPGG